ncbi:MAG TPA: hypothetical protein PKL68_00960 [Actinomycetota bacterium]|nr:hypothetical protein [Actinomycetota bacterium]MCB8996883.1 hypothetical protein [Actinomycetota bacterium]MCB9424274.1 hypothetical protein [Actinomycetota bacterium]HNE87833.1 hypothetical protein [Actinomycetota bacterium]HNL50498.1 hypothetical protein [Actinomycetota bacterium]
MLRRLLIAITVLSIGAAASPAFADSDLVIKVAHPAVTANLNPVTPGTASPGDLRTFYAKLTKPGKSTRIGFMTGSLLTTEVGVPSAGKEYRTADLVFSIGKARNQLIVGGVAVYQQQAPTVAERTSVVRPVIGGSGKYDGARGWCESIHRKDGTWRHTFHVQVRS